MKRILKLNESDLNRIVRRVINEQSEKTVSMKLDCDKKTIEGFKLSQEQLTNFCYSGRWGAPGGGGPRPTTGGGGGAKY